MRIDELRRWGRAELNRACHEHNDQVQALEVDLLLAHALGVEREYLTIHGDQISQEVAKAFFYKLVARRCAYEPIAYLLGIKEFYSLPFVVNPAVLIPRPETELIVERAVRHIFDQQQALVFIDVGTGSGAILLSVVHELKKRAYPFLQNSIFLGTDVSLEALRVAQENAGRLSLAGYVNFIAADLLEAVQFGANTAYRMIVANLPYIGEGESLPSEIEQYEPQKALRTGKQGLELISRLVEQSSGFFTGDVQGALLLEFGHLQHLEVECLIRRQAWGSMNFCQDFQGIKRIIEVISDCA